MLEDKLDESIRVPMHKKTKKRLILTARKRGYRGAGGLARFFIEQGLARMPDTNS